MENIISTIKIIPNEPTSNNFEQLENEIDKIFHNIKLSNHFINAEEHFKLLNQIQFELALLVFKKNISVSERLRRFVQDFDRLDDESECKRLYIQIINNEYSF
jgi:hypothetical protein